MSHDTPLVIAHRTTMGHAPENTLLGIRQALEMDCDGVEIDVQLSADGVPVLIHDDLLDRTTNGSGPVGEATLAALRALDAGQGEQIPTLREALELIDGRMLFGLNSNSPWRRLAGPRRCMKSPEMRGRVLALEL